MDLESRTSPHLRGRVLGSVQCWAGPPASYLVGSVTWASYSPGWLGHTEMESFRA